MSRSPFKLFQEAMNTDKLFIAPDSKILRVMVARENLILEVHPYFSECDKDIISQRFPLTRCYQADGREKTILGPNILGEAQKWIDATLGNQQNFEIAEFWLITMPSDMFAIKQIANATRYNLIGCKDTTALKNNLKIRDSVQSMHFDGVTDLWPDILDVPAFVNCSVLHLMYCGNLPSVFFQRINTTYNFNNSICSQKDINCLMRRMIDNLPTNTETYYFRCNLNEPKIDHEILFQNVCVQKDNNGEDSFTIYMNNNDSEDNKSKESAIPTSRKIGQCSRENKSFQFSLDGV